MLNTLSIKNYALIDELKISFNPGFSVITGETGAGKSIILGAIGLLLGQRADYKAIKKDAAKCIIEATFNLNENDLIAFFAENELEYDAEECIVRREISANGKSRAFVNDSPTSLNVLKELGEQLIDIHSQHQNLLLNKEDFQQHVVDTIAMNGKERAAYTSAYQDYMAACEALEEAQTAYETNRRDEDFMRFQWEQLKDAKLQQGEQEELEAEYRTLSHAEEIKSTLYKTADLLENDASGIVHVLKETNQTIASIRSVCPPCEDLYERLMSTYIEIKDISSEIQSLSEHVDFNPSRMEIVNDRLNLLYSLQQKHHVDHVDALIAIQDELEKKLNALDNNEERIALLRKTVKKCEEEAYMKAAVLTESRKKASAIIEKQLKNHLIPLGIPNVNFEISCQPRPKLDVSGYDSICFLFSANKNSTLQPISQIASGGEIARVMLSLKAMLSGAVKLPTIIFDEIDTGVSGKIAEKMAHIMCEMGVAERQVISITHLPQIAAAGHTHYKVYKEDHEEETVSHIIELSKEERVQEIAQMLSGANLTEAALNNAKELLSNAL